MNVGPEALRLAVSLVVFSCSIPTRSTSAASQNRLSLQKKGHKKPGDSQKMFSLKLKPLGGRTNEARRYWLLIPQMRYRSDTYRAGRTLAGDRRGCHRQDTGTSASWCTTRHAGHISRHRPLHIKSLPTSLISATSILRAAILAPYDDCLHELKHITGHPSRLRICKEPRPPSPVTVSSVECKLLGPGLHHDCVHIFWCSLYKGLVTFLGTGLVHLCPLLYPSPGDRQVMESRLSRSLRKAVSTGRANTGDLRSPSLPVDTSCGAIRCVAGRARG